MSDRSSSQSEVTNRSTARLVTFNLDRDPNPAPKRIYIQDQTKRDPVKRRASTRKASRRYYERNQLVLLIYRQLRYLEGIDSEKIRRHDYYLRTGK